MTPLEINIVLGITSIIITFVLYVIAKAKRHQAAHCRMELAEFPNYDVAGLRDFGSFMVSLLVLGCVHSIAHHVLSNSSSNPDKIEYDFGCCEFIFSLLCGLLVILACFSYKDSCCSGQTYGKQKANVLVVDQHGNYPSFWQAMVRNALLFLLLGFLRSSSAKQPFHDFVAKTILIKTGP